jgi:hypothetical protein
MALFRKFFYKKPPDGLLEITERVYGTFLLHSFLCICEQCCLLLSVKIVSLGVLCLWVVFCLAYFAHSVWIELFELI